MSNKEKILSKIKKSVKEIEPKSEIILFGSRARGDERADSDWDFLILLEADELSKEIKEEIQDRLYEIELETEQVISSLIHTKQDWSNRAVTPLYEIIQEEGYTA